MSASGIAYHLRPNKALDRALFAEALSLVDSCLNTITGGIYVTMGGPFLEDVRTMSHHFRFAHHYSIDASAATVRRQNLNRPCRNLSIDCMRSGNLITTFDQHCPRGPGQGAVVWLDYTAPDARAEQIREATQLFATLRENDILRVTLNCSVHTLGTPPANLKERQTFHLERLRQQLGDLLPSDAGRDDTLAAKFGALLLRTVQKAFTSVASARACPLLVNEYADGPHRMITITVIKTPTPDQMKVRLEAASFGSAPLSWQIQQLKLPDLSTLERARIDEQLPRETTISAIDGQLGNPFHDNPTESTSILAEYERYRRFYPAFARISV